VDLPVNTYDIVEDSEMIMPQGILFSHTWQRVFYSKTCTVRSDVCLLSSWFIISRAGNDLYYFNS